MRAGQILKAAVIGCGNIGSKRAAAIAAHPASKLSLVVDPDRECTKTLAFQFGCATATDWRCVLDSDVQIVIVSVPTHAARDIVVPLLEAGLHVLCEKPLGRNLSEAREITELARVRDVVLETGFTLRFDAGLRRAWEAVTQGAIGTPYFLKCEYVNGAVLTNTNRVGSLLDIGIHSLDLVLWFLGSVEIVFAGLNAHEREPDDNGFVVLRKGDVLAQIHFSLVRWRNLFRFEASGSEGYVLVDSLPKWGVQTVTIGRRTFPSGVPQETSQTFSEDTSWQDEWAHVVRCVTGEQSSTDLEKGLWSMVLATAIRESAKRGTAVRVPWSVDAIEAQLCQP